MRAAVHYELERGTPGIDIHSHLVEVYDPNVMSTQMAQRWCQQFRVECICVLDDARPGAQQQRWENITERVEELIQRDRRDCGHRHGSQYGPCVGSQAHP
jgi:hypothetical protein